VADLQARIAGLSPQKRKAFELLLATKKSRPCVHELFEQQVAQCGSAPAVQFEGGRFSYSELNGRANQLARYLRKIGVGREMRVGICMERSIEMVVGLLGGAKLGSVAIPFPLVGTFLGAVAGGVLGSGVGRLLALGLVKAGGAVIQGTKATTSTLAKAAAS